MLLQQKPKVVREQPHFPASAYPATFSRMTAASKRAVLYGALGFVTLLGAALLSLASFPWLAVMWLEGVWPPILLWLGAIIASVVRKVPDEEPRVWLWLQPLALVGPLGALALAAATYGSDSTLAGVGVVVILLGNLLGTFLLIGKRTPSPWVGLSLFLLVAWSSLWSWFISGMAIADDWL